MWQMVIAYILVQGWIIDPNEHWFFYQPGEVLLFPAHYTEVVDVGSVISDVTVVIDGEGAFRCSFNLSPNVLAVSPIYSPSHSNLSHLNLYIMPLLLVMWSLSFGATSSSFRVLPLLRWACMPYFLPMFFIVSLRPSSYGTVMWLLYVVWMFLLFGLVFGASIFSFILFIVQFGHLCAVRALCIFVCSSSSNFLLEQMFFALCRSVLIMLYFLFMAWWLSHCKYWFVWVGFL